MAIETAGAAASAAGAGAASAGGAASSAPASTGAGGGAADAGGAVLTDDAILGITEGNGDTSGSGTGAAAATQTATSAQTGATQQTTQQAATQQTTQAAPAELTIDQFKALFQANPQVQSLWDRYDAANKAITQFGTPAEAREAAATIQAIGGVKELTNLAAKASGADQTDAAFFGGSKADRAGLVNEWYDGEGAHEFPVTSKAIAEMTEVSLDTMSQRDKPNYQRIVGDLTKRALASVGHGEAVLALRAARESGEGIEEAVDKFLQLTDYYGLAKAGAARGDSPEARQLAADRAAFEKQRSEFTDSKSMEAVKAADAKVGAAVNGEIEQALAGLKVNGRPFFGNTPLQTQLRAQLAEKIRLAVDDEMAKNPLFVSQVHALRARGGAREQELFDLTMRFARLALPKAVEAVMTPWTESVVGQANGTADRARAGASRTEVGGGSASPGGTKKQPFTSDELKRKGGYGTLTDEEILNS